MVELWFFGLFCCSVVLLFVVCCSSSHDVFVICFLSSLSSLFLFLSLSLSFCSSLSLSLSLSLPPKYRYMKLLVKDGSRSLGDMLNEEEVRYCFIPFIHNKLFTIGNLCFKYGLTCLRIILLFFHLSETIFTYSS